MILSESQVAAHANTRSNNTSPNNSDGHDDHAAADRSDAERIAQYRRDHGADCFSEYIDLIRDRMRDTRRRRILRVLQSRSNRLLRRECRPDRGATGRDSRGFASTGLIVGVCGFVVLAVAFVSFALPDVAAGVRLAFTSGGLR